MTLGGASTNVCTTDDAATLSPVTKNFNVANFAAIKGTTVRLGFINAAHYAGHEVIGIDNVKLMVAFAE